MTRRIHPVGGRVVLVTGAARGIGAESARRLAARGARVALVDVDAEALQAVARDCPGSSSHRADVADDAALRAAVAAAAQRFGGIDAVVANAGIAAMGPARSMDPRHFERTLEVNLLGAYRTIHAALPHLLARRGYALVVSSLAAIAHAPGLAAYSASKAGLEAMADALRTELASRGVAVGVAYFSWIDTAMVRGADASAVASGVRSLARPPFHKVYPVADAGRAVVDGIERRRRHVFHPPWLRLLLPLRGLAQPLLDRELSRAVARLDARSAGIVAEEGGKATAPVGAGGAADARHGASRPDR